MRSKSPLKLVKQNMFVVNVMQGRNHILNIGGTNFMYMYMYM